MRTAIVRSRLRPARDRRAADWACASAVDQPAEAPLRALSSPPPLPPAVSCVESSRTRRLRVLVFARHAEHVGFTTALINPERQLRVSRESSQYGRTDRLTFPVTLRDDSRLSGGAALGELLVSRGDPVEQIGELALLVGAQRRPSSAAARSAGRARWPPTAQAGLGEDDGAYPPVGGVRLAPGQPALLEGVDDGGDVGGVAGEGGSQLAHRGRPGAGQPQQRLDTGGREIVLLAGARPAGFAPRRAAGSPARRARHAGHRAARLLAEGASEAVTVTTCDGTPIVVKTTL